MIHHLVHGPPSRDAVPTVCACGWQSTTITFLPSEHEAAYERHLIEALGVDAFYGAGAACLNCGYEQTVSVLVGRPVQRALCQRCGTSSLVPRNDVIDEHSSRSS